MTEVVASLELLRATLFGPLRVMAEVAAAALAHDRAPTLADLAGIRPLAYAELRRPDRLVAGSGLITDPSLIADAPWHLAWWTLSAAGITPLRTVTDPARDGFRDYTVLEWWAVPGRTGREHVTGPYVDYLCTDAYTLTFTVPVHRPDGSMAAVVGSDVYVARAERFLLSALRACGRPATVVNTTGRVVLSTYAGHATGSLMRAPESGWVREPAGAGVPFSVLLKA